MNDEERIKDDSHLGEESQHWKMRGMMMMILRLLHTSRSIGHLPLQKRCRRFALCALRQSRTLANGTQVSQVSDILVRLYDDSHLRARDSSREEVIKSVLVGFIFTGRKAGAGRRYLRHRFRLDNGAQRMRE